MFCVRKRRESSARTHTAEQKQQKQQKQQKIRAHFIFSSPRRCSYSAKVALYLVPMWLAEPWAAEVERSHSARLLTVIESRGVVCRTLTTSRDTESVLFLSNINLVTPGVLPIECLKYINRIFYVPHSARDPYWFRVHPETQDLIRQNASIRIQALPKSLEMNVAEALIGDEDNVINVILGVSPDNIKPSHYSHIFQCIYDDETGVFRWGIIAEQDSIEHVMTSEALMNAVSVYYKENRVVPICRAFFKMKEMMDHYFPLWGWSLPDEKKAVDIGASPGGWTQCLLLHSSNTKVLAVDPGALNEQLLAEKGNRIEYVKAIAQAPETAEAIKRFGGFDLCVCDVNFDAEDAAIVLRDYVMKYANVSALSNGVGVALPSDPFIHKPQGSACYKNSIVSMIESEGLPLGNETESFRKRKMQELDTYLSSISQSVVHHQPGYLILTLKLMKNPKEKHLRSAVKSVIEALSQGQEGNAGVFGYDFRLVHLNANSQNERTIACKFYNVYNK